MKKNLYHVNPVVNKWEEDQRRARMEKMILRAKSTLPPEARGASKPSGPKKPSPYAAENATKPPRKQNSSGQEGQPTSPAVNVQELDSLIYNRVQEILGMPLMRRVAATRAATGKAGTPPKPPQPGRSGRRPAWNNDWTAQTGSTGSTPEDKRGAKTGGVDGRTQKVLDWSPSKPVSTPGGSVRSQPTGFGTPKRAVPPRAGAVSPVDLAAVGSNHAAGHAPRRMISTTHIQGAGDRVVLLSSPTSRSTAGGAGFPPRPASGRYTVSGGEGSDPAPSGQLLEQSVMSAVRVLNPHSSAAQEAAARNEQRPAGHEDSYRGVGALGAVSPQPGNGAFGCAGRGGRDIPTGQSLVSHSRAAQGVGGSSSGGGSDGPRRASLAHPAGIPAGPAPSRQPHPAHPPHEDEDAYADDDFEEYDGSDEDRRGARPGVAEEPGEEGEGPGQVGAVPDVAMLRSSVNALNALVQMKIQELARCQPPQATSCQARTSASGEPKGAFVPAVDMLASLALAGMDDADAACDVEARRELGDSGVMDGLRQSDLDYLSRLGGGELADGAEGQELGNSADERLFVLEPGAPTGSARAWGDRQAWQREDTGATGLQLLRARQEKEKQVEGQGLGQGGRRLSGNGVGRGSEAQEQSVAQAVRAEEAKGRSTAAGADEEDSVLLGETLSPRQRTGTALQMQAVGSALAALASSGQLNANDAQELQTQTNALFGSLVQLHNLMRGPRAADLYGSAGNMGSTATAGGFTPTNLSPKESPSQSLRRRAHDGDANTEPNSSNGSAGRGSVPLRPINVQAAEQVRANDAAAAANAAGVPGQSGHGSHIQLTPKHRLVAEDVAWMAGLMQSLSKSLQVDDLEA